MAAKTKKTERSWPCDPGKPLVFLCYGGGVRCFVPASVQANSKDDSKNSYSDLHLCPSPSEKKKKKNSCGEEGAWSPRFIQEVL